jgi:hypothetical protein
MKMGLFRVCYSVLPNVPKSPTPLSFSGLENRLTMHRKIPPHGAGYSESYTQLSAHPYATHFSVGHDLATHNVHAGSLVPQTHYNALSSFNVPSQQTAPRQSTKRIRARPTKIVTRRTNTSSRGLGVERCHSIAFDEYHAARDSGIFIRDIRKSNEDIALQLVAGRARMKQILTKSILLKIPVSSADYFKVLIMTGKFTCCSGRATNMSTFLTRLTSGMPMEPLSV